MLKFLHKACRQDIEIEVERFEDARDTINKVRHLHKCARTRALVRFNCKNDACM